MNFDSIRNFLLVAELRNLSAAANILKVNQTTLGRQIRMLEKEIGTPLVLRTYRGIFLTEEGLKFQELSLRLIGLIDNAKKTIQKELKDEKGMLTLFAWPGTSQLIIAHLAKFSNEYPCINLNLEFFSQSRSSIDGETETFFLPEGLMTNDPNMIHEKIYDIRLKMYTSSAYAEVHGVPKTLDELADHRLVLLENHNIEKTENVNFFLEFIPPEKRDSLRILKVHNTPDLLSALIGGLGIGMYWEGPSISPPQSLIDIFPNMHGPTISYFFSYRESLKDSGKTKAFLMFLKSTFREKIES